MRSRFAFADRAQNLGAEVRTVWIAPVATQRARLERQVAALVNRAPPRASLDLPASERATLEKLSTASQLASAERRALFTSVHEESRAFANAANDLRALHATAFADRLVSLAAEVGPDPQRPGSADPARAADPGYCWDVVLNEKLTAASAQLRAVEPVTTPEFEFLEGPKATRAAFFGLIQWIAQPLGLKFEGGSDRLRGRWNNGRISDYKSTYWEIIPEKRIVYAYEMFMNDSFRMSVSLATIEFEPEVRFTLR